MNSKAGTGDSTLLEGVLHHTVFFNPQNFFTVAKFQVEGARDPVTVVGNFHALKPGDTLRLEGSWEENPKFGLQFVAKSYEIVVPTTLGGIKKYLSSGRIRGVGEEIAERIIRLFGEDTPSIIEKDPGKLTKVEGIGKKRAAGIHKSWMGDKELRGLMIFLNSHGIGAGVALRIHKKYGKDSVRVLKENPYRLASEVEGIGFKTADKVGLSLGIEKSSPERLRAGIIYVLSQMAENGHVFCPVDFLKERMKQELGIEEDDVLDDLAGILPPEVLAREAEGGCRLYLRRLYDAEMQVAEHMKRVKQTRRTVTGFNPDRAVKWLEESQNIAFSGEQKDAIAKLASCKMLVITGGPGTGKTTLVKGICQVMNRLNQNVMLAAPTGRAAKRLSEASGFQAKTIHRLLEFNPYSMTFRKNEEDRLEADVVVVDETSMVDILLMRRLLSAIEDHTILILVGDAAQLPAVGPGDVLRDVIKSGFAEVVELKTVFRQASESKIIANAHRIRNGLMPLEKGQEESDFFFIEKQDPLDAAEMVKKLVVDRIPAKFGFDPVWDIQVLSPMYRGAAGVDNLNSSLRELLNPARPGSAAGPYDFRANDKVMQLSNNYEKEVFNGDIGRVESFNSEEGILAVNFDGRVVEYAEDETEQVSLSYAVSVHKAQGSEYRGVVVVLLGQHYVLLERNLLYTAVTRAKELVVLVGSRQAVEIAVSNRRVRPRYTSLVELLRAAPSP